MRFSDINRRLSTEQVLFRHNLGEEHLLSLSNQPAKLIFTLYEHPSIIRRRAGSRILDKLPGNGLVIKWSLDVYYAMSYLFQMH